LILDQTRTAEIPTQLCTNFVSIAKNIQSEYTQIKDYVDDTFCAALVDFITAVLDNTLSIIPPLKGFHEPFAPEEPAFSAPAKPQSLAYQRVSLDLSFARLKEFPQFVLWRPKCFERFLLVVVASDRLEPISSPLKPQVVSEIISRAYYLSMASDSGSGQDREVKLAHEHINALLAVKSDHPLFLRTLAARLTILMGFCTALKSEDDSKIVWKWREQFSSLLDKFTTDPNSTIQRLAWSVDTEKDVASTEFASLFPPKKQNSGSSRPRRRGRSRSPEPFSIFDGAPDDGWGRDAGWGDEF